MSRALPHQLLRIGRASTGTSEGHRLRWWATLAAAVTLTTALTLLVLVVAAYAGREARDAARSPQEAAFHPSETPTALWGWFPDSYQLRYADIIYIAPLSSDAALPPGVNRWPEPGEVLLSPALANEGEAEGVQSRYGTVVGTISPEGLAAPTERLAYVRPSDELLDPRQMTPIVGYGTEQGFGIGDKLRERPQRDFLILVAGFLVLPALLFVVVAARMGSRPAGTGEQLC